MSITFYDQKNFRRIHRQAWGRFFGLCIGGKREEGGRSVEEVARLAGMETAEWLAVEAGQVPPLEQLLPMADALELGHDKIATLAVLCQEAWEA
jgi:hypothetical protein